MGILTSVSSTELLMDGQQNQTYPPSPQGVMGNPAVAQVQPAGLPPAQPGQYYGQDCYAIGQQVGLSPPEVDTAYNAFSQLDPTNSGSVPSQALAGGNVLQSLLGG